MTLKRQKLFLGKSVPLSELKKLSYPHHYSEFGTDIPRNNYWHFSGIRNLEQ